MDSIFSSYYFPFDWDFDDNVAIEVQTPDANGEENNGITEEQLDNAIKEALQTVQLTGEGLVYTLTVDGSEAGKIIVPKDQFLKSVEYQEESKSLVFTFVTEADDDKVVSIGLGDIFNVDNLATKDEVEAKLDKNTYETEKANFAQKSEIPSIDGLAKESDMANKLDVSVYESDKETFALKSEIPSIEGLATSEDVADAVKDLATEEYVGQEIAKVEIPSIEGLASKSEVSEEINNAVEGLVNEDAISDMLTKTEAEESYQKKGDYVEYLAYGEERKTINLKKRDTISSEGVQIAMVSDYEGLDFPVTEIGGQKAALVLNSNEQPVKVEITEGDKRVQYVVATEEDVNVVNDKVSSLTEKIVTLEDTINKLTMPASEYGTVVSKELSAGGKVSLVKDVKIETGKDINLIKNSDIDLGGHTLSSIGGTYGDTCVVGNGADVVINNGEIVASDGASQEKQSATILVKTSSASKLTLNNVKVTGFYPLYVNSANEKTLVVINGGEIAPSPDFEDPDKCNPAVYVGKGSNGSTTGGKVIINGGTFGKQNVVNNYLLNVEDILRKQEGKTPIDFIEVRGGVFWNFNPANNKAEGENTNFVANGYKVNTEVINNTTTKYTVVPEA